jgi:polyferredoxin
MLQYADLAVLAAALGGATWLAHRSRSRRGLTYLSVFSLAYFGFYREGCICAIGSLQNVALTLFDRSYAIPLTVLAFFLAPIVVALFFGRTFCAAVCPHGALQDLVLIKPVRVPAWLEHGLGVIPFLFLGAGAILAATGCGFIICRYDPFVPLFRLSGSLALVTLGAAFVGVGLFVGRPYCRFFCPYGALLRLAALASKWRVRVTPNVCTQCRLCEHACPYGAMREPTPAGAAAEPPGVERRRLTRWLLVLPLLVAGGALIGSRLGPAAAQLHPTVALAELHLANQQTPANYPPMTPEALALERAAADPDALLASARALRGQFVVAAWLFGGWAGLVVGLKLISLSLRVTRTDFEPDRGACVACARCFLSCPNERARLGLPPEPGTPVAAPNPQPAEPVLSRP